MLEVSINRQLGDLHLDVSFASPGGVTVLFGESGAGKTSVLRAVAGLLPCPSLKLHVGSSDLADLPPEDRRIGYVFQDARLFPHLSVAQNLDFGARFGRQASADTRAHMIDLLDIGPLLDRAPRGLSGGEKQRVAIGRALLSDPRLLAMDEPLASLDAPRRAQILPYLERLRDETDIPILYVSHDATEVARLATTLVVIKTGHVVQSGPVEEVLSNPEALPDLGVRAAGAVLRATVTAHEGDLSILSFAGGILRLPRVAARLGEAIRVRVAAQDIIIATEAPKAISALNVLEGMVEALHYGQGPGVAVRLRVGDTPILARITKTSAQALKLETGMTAYAVLKATAFDPAGVGT